MKRKLLSIGVVCLLFMNAAHSQEATINQDTQNGKHPISNYNNINPNVPTYSIPVPNMAQIEAEDAINDSKGLLYRIGVPTYVNVTSINSGIWTTLPNGDKKWQLAIKNTGAEALSFIFSNFKLTQGSIFFVQDRTGKTVSKVLTKADMLEDFQQNIALCFGDNLILTLIDKAYATPSEFTLDRVMYNYRSTGNPGPQKINESESCNVNVNCPEGTNYQDEKKGVARIYVVDSSGAGWCTGTLVNNTSNDCKPLFLTALHCGPSTSVANMNLWQFYFNYESTNCSNPSTAGTLDDYYITGCVRLADSGDGGNITLSDFLLVQLGTLANEATTITTLKSANYGAYWNGWDANNTAAPSGVGIHHPSGDIKKISSYTSSLTSTTYTGSTANTHWQAYWVSTTTNWGITEGGSSGSALYTYNGGNSRIVGTLSGGASSCTASAANKNDLYGKMSYHWTSCGTAANRRLKTYLDPGNTGLMVQDGSFNPCAPAVNAPPVANFSASTTSPCVGSNVTFTDASTNTPTSWAWTFSPTSVTYVNGTSASSQNPQVQFNGAGPYTVTLVATNAYGNDNEIKTSYITPTSGGTLPLIENFEGATFPPTGWTIENDDAPTSAWGTEGAKGLERRTATGNTGSTSGCAGIELFNYATDTLLKDNLISSALDLTGASAPKITFKRAYKTYVSTSNPTNYRDELKVYVSTDCGATWGTEVYFKKGAQLASNGTSNTTFTPSLTTDWDTDTIDLTTYVGQTIKVKFEIGNKWGNNLYLDDINISNSAPVAASVSISSSDTDNSICTGTSVTFTATPTNGGTAPAYQWQLNGSNVGTNASTYTTTSLTSGQSVTCIMTSNLPSVTGNPATSNAIVTTVNAVPVTPTITTNSPVCSGSAINLSTATVTNATYAWSGPNSFNNTTQNPVITSATSAMTGTYNLTVTVNGCASTAGTASVVVNTSVTPSVSIAITAGQNPTCISESVTFTATSTNDGSTPSYQWTVNGSNAGTNSVSFTPSSLANNDVITCILTSNAVCASPTTATSSSITMTVATSLTPSVAIGASSNPACIGSSVTFSATPVNEGSTPSYQWQVNGSNVGTNASTYTSSSLTDGQIVSCIITSSLSCASPTTGASNNVMMTVNPVPSTPTITLSGGNTLTSSSANGNQWYVNGTIINGATAQTYVAPTNGNYTVIVTDGDCSSAASEIVTTTIGIKEADNNGTSIAIFPNPSDGKFTVVFTSTENMNFKFELQNLIGQLIYSENIKDFNGTYSKDFDMTEFGKGEYFMVITDSKQHKTEKLIVY